MTAALHRLSFALQAILIAIVVGWVLDAPRALGLALYTEQFLALIVGLALPLPFLLVRVNGERRPAPWYDVIAGAVGLGCCLYIAVRYPVLVTELVYRPWDGV